jgi:hypothetical protein
VYPFAGLSVPPGGADNRVHVSIVDLDQFIAAEGVAVGGAFASDTATGMRPAAHRVAGVLRSWRS